MPAHYFVFGSEHVGWPPRGCQQRQHAQHPHTAIGFRRWPPLLEDKEGVYQLDADMALGETCILPISST